MNKNWGSEQWVGGAATTGASGTHNLTEGADYVKFTFTTATDMDTLWIEYKGVAPDDFASFNGLQLAAVPEPATIGLVGLVGTLMLMIRRRFCM